MKPIDIAPRDLDTVQGILARHIPLRDVRAFGSRVTQTAKPFSDLDLAVMGDRPLPDSLSAELKEAFRESDLPFKVDVVDWASTDAAFREIIIRQTVLLHKSAKPAPDETA